MLKDRYDNPISTHSETARDLYVQAVDRLLGAAPDLQEGFGAVVDADPEFALGYSGLARACQITADLPKAQAAMAKAQSLAANLPEQEAAHLRAMGLLINGRIAEAYPAIRAHVARYPRDAMLAQTCTSIFGLIGFSGLPGREAELLAYTATLLPHFGEDWWCLSQHAFSLCETGQIDQAAKIVDRSLALNPRNAHAAHVRSHVYYESGETTSGLAYLNSWLRDYEKRGQLHGHLSWHLALWALDQGDVDRIWQTIDASIVPDASLGPPINVLTDTASILYRAELAGETVSADRWKSISAYAKCFFPMTGVCFADLHAALAHAMAGEGDALNAIIANPRGTAADLVKAFAEAYRAIAQQNWAEATAHLTTAMADHARIGGSRAQRDLLEQTLLGTLLKQGRDEEARRLLVLRRPVLATTSPVAGV